MTTDDQIAWDGAVAELRRIRDAEPGVLDSLSVELTHGAALESRLGDMAKERARARLMVAQLCYVLAHEDGHGEPPSA